MSSKFVCVGAAMCGAVLVSSCGDSTQPVQCDPSIEWAEPVLQITGVNDVDGGSIGSFVLSEFFLDGAELSAASLVENLPGANASVSGTSLECAVACGFGRMPGSYSFRISAAGFKSKVVSQSADYTGVDRRQCPHRFVGGTKVTITLERLD